MSLRLAGCGFEALPGHTKAASLHAYFPQVPQLKVKCKRLIMHPSGFDNHRDFNLSALCRPLQVFDLHSGPKPVVFVLHSFLSAKLTRMGLLT